MRERSAQHPWWHFGAVVYSNVKIIWLCKTWVWFWLQPLDVLTLQSVLNCSLYKLYFVLLTLCKMIVFIVYLHSPVLSFTRSLDTWKLKVHSRPSPLSAWLPSNWHKMHIIQSPPWLLSNPRVHWSTYFSYTFSSTSYVKVEKPLKH